MSNLACVYFHEKKYSDSEVLYKQCFDKMKVALGESHPDTLNAMSTLASNYYDQGKFRDAEVLYKQCLAKMKVVLGESHPNTLSTMKNLARINSVI